MGFGTPHWTARHNCLPPAWWEQTIRVVGHSCWLARRASASNPYPNKIRLQKILSRHPPTKRTHRHTQAKPSKQKNRTTPVAPANLRFRTSKSRTSGKKTKKTKRRSRQHLPLTCLVRVSRRLAQRLGGAGQAQHFGPRPRGPGAQLLLGHEVLDPAPRALKHLGGAFDAHGYGAHPRLLICLVFVYIYIYISVYRERERFLYVFFGANK